MRYSTKAAETFEMGCYCPTLEFDYGDPAISKTYITKWVDEDRGLWCWVAHDPEGNCINAITEEDFEELRERAPEQAA